MSKRINPAWVRNLCEVGHPITEAAADIIATLNAADEALAVAQRAHEAAEASARLRVVELEGMVRELWGPAEIAAAKRGKMLVDGKELEGLAPVRWGWAVKLINQWNVQCRYRNRRALARWAMMQNLIARPKGKGSLAWKRANILLSPRPGAIVWPDYCV